MEIIINNHLIKVETGKIYGLITHEAIDKKNNYLLNSDYYQELLDSDNPVLTKMEQLLGVKNNLAITDNKRKRLARLFMVNDKYYLIENFEKNFTHIDNFAFTRMFRNICRKYNKTVILKSNDMNYLLDVVDYFILLEKEEIISKDNYYDSRLYEFIDKPVILKFIENALSKDIKIKYITNRLDLLKVVYRLVK